MQFDRGIHTTYTIMPIAEIVLIKGVWYQHFLLNEFSSKRYDYYIIIYYFTYIEKCF